MLIYAGMSAYLVLFCLHDRGVIRDTFTRLIYLRMTFLSVDLLEIFSMIPFVSCQNGHMAKTMDVLPTVRNELVI